MKKMNLKKYTSSSSFKSSSCLRSLNKIMKNNILKFNLGHRQRATDTKIWFSTIWIPWLSPRQLILMKGLSCLQKNSSQMAAEQSNEMEHSWYVVNSDTERRWH